MDPKHMFYQATDHVASTMACATADKYDRPTPCTEWNVKQLLTHMINEVSWVPDLLAGKTIAEVGTKYDGDLIGDDASDSWERALGLARAAVDKADLQATAHLSYADVTNAHYIAEVAADVLIHSWDLGQGVNCNIIFDPKLAQTVYDLVSPRAEEFKKSGLFGDPIPVPEDADIATKLLAFYGRKR